MKLHKIISKSKDGKHMEVIAMDKNECFHTLHIHKYRKVWQYCAGYLKNVDKKGNITKEKILLEFDMGGLTK